MCGDIPSLLMRSRHHRCPSATLLKRLGCSELVSGMPLSGICNITQSAATMTSAISICDAWGPARATAALLRGRGCPGSGIYKRCWRSNGNSSEAAVVDRDTTAGTRVSPNEIIRTTTSDFSGCGLMVGFSFQGQAGKLIEWTTFEPPGEHVSSFMSLTPASADRR